jgi:penicillin-binding protein-related factor A (putative recombinase)
LSGSKTNSIKSSSMTEKEIENEILMFLNLLPGCKAWKNQSVGIFDPVKGIYRKNRSRWTAKGTSDILGIYKGKMLCLEVKSASGRASPEQKQFIEEMNELGAIAGIVRSWQDAERLLGLHKE